MAHNQIHNLYCGLFKNLGPIKSFQNYREISLGIKKEIIQHPCTGVTGLNNVNDFQCFFKVEFGIGRR